MSTAKAPAAPSDRICEKRLNNVIFYCLINNGSISGKNIEAIETISKASIETTLYKRCHNNAIPMLIQC